MWRELKAGIAYVRHSPLLLALMCLAFLLNLTAFPLFAGLLPYVAKEIYGTGQTGLGYMVAGAAFGALVASIMMSRHGAALRLGRATVVGSVVWFAFLLVFAHVTHHLAGIFVLFLAGCAQGAGQVPMVTALLRASGERFRGRVMGIRMLALYGNVPGLLIAGQLVDQIGFPLTATIYCAIGIAFTVLIAVRWRKHLWRRDAPVNAR